MNELGRSNGLATAVLGLCALAFTTVGCDGGKDDVSTSNDQGGETNDDTTAAGSETDGETDDAGETEDDSDDTGPPPEGLGCGMAPACDRGTFEGNLTIAGEADIETIAGYSHISGFLQIRRSDFTCLDFLACLETARGLTIENNDWLVDVDGFSNLEEVPFLITVASNPMLEHLRGFDALRKVSSDQDALQLGPRGINIYNNDLLEVIDTFNEVREFEGDLTITNNDNLVEISGFSRIDTIHDHPNADPEAGTMGKPTRLGGSLTISRNPKLETVSGLDSVIVIYKNLTIQYNTVLTKLTGLHGLMALGGALLITNNPELCVSEACRVGCDLAQGPGPGSSTANNKDC